MPARRKPAGFTLIEMVMVIVIMGTIAAAVASFMKSPVDAYFATARRAALVDVTDLALRRMARDVRSALPNSVSVSGGATSQCLELIPTKAGGRYLADGSNSALAFDQAVTRFDMLGGNSASANPPVPTEQQIVNGDAVVVYNLGIPGADAFDATLPKNTAIANGAPTDAAGIPVTRTTVNIFSNQFPLPSPNNRFHVVPGGEKTVAYVCDTVAGTLRRQGSSNFTHLCQGVATGAGALLAKNVSSCAFTYGGSDLVRNGLVGITLQLTSGGETVSLQHDVHINNTP